MDHSPVTQRLQGERDQLICYEALRKNRGGGAYIVPLHNNKEFLGQPFSAVSKRFFSLRSGPPCLFQQKNENALFAVSSLYQVIRCKRYGFKNILETSLQGSFFFPCRETRLQ